MEVNRLLEDRLKTVSFSEIKLYRTLFLLGTVLPWIFYYCYVFYHGKEQYLPDTIIISFVFGISLCLSFVNKYVKRYLTRLLFTVFLFVSFYTIYIAYLDHFTPDLAIAVMLVIFSTSLIFKRSLHLGIYNGISFIAVAVAALSLPEVAINVPLYLSALATAGIVAYFIARKREDVQRMLQMSNNLMEEMYHQSPDAVLVYDPVSKRFAACNDTALSVFEATDKETVFRQLLDSEQIRLNQKLDHIHQAFQANKEWSEEVYFKTATAKDHWGFLTIRQLHFESHHLWLIRLMDITSRKEKEAAQRRQAILQKTIEAKKQFIANITHELKSPLTGFFGGVDLLYATKLDEEQKNYMDLLSESCHTMKKLIDDLMQLAEVEADEIKINHVVFSPQELVDEIYQAFKIQAEDKGLFLRYTISEQVPQKLIADPFRIKQLLNNLVSNAVKYTTSGSVEILVSPLHINKQETVLRFQVKDTGIGISEQDQLSMFERYTRFQKNGKNEGTGLGLSICKLLIERLGGEIGVDSRPGKGSNFWFDLQLQIARQKQEIA